MPHGVELDAIEVAFKALDFFDRLFPEFWLPDSSPTIILSSLTDITVRAVPLIGLLWLTSKVWSVRYRQPFFEICFRFGQPRVVREILPLMRIGLSVVEFLSAVAVADIVKLAEGTYIAQLRLQPAEGAIIDIDCRPSDAIAISVTHDPPLPIFVAENVLDAASQS